MSAKESIERVLALCDRWDALSKGETATTRQIREAVAGEADYLGQIKYIRAQAAGHTVVEFLNGSRACSCWLERGETPVLR